MVVAGLASGAALAVKLLIAPMVVLFGVWLAAEVRRGRLDRCRAWRAAAATVAPALVAAVPFQVWHPAVFLTDPFGPSPIWATAVPAAAVLALGAWRVWSRPSLRTLFGVSGLVLLGVLFHRSFMFYYVDVPATAFALAALVPLRSPGAA